MSVSVNLSPLFFKDENLKKARIYKVEGNIIGECISRLIEKKAELKLNLFDTTGKFADNVRVFINRTPIAMNILAHPVKDGDEIRITPGGG
jgi:molybdopterin converting factor small subunit